MLCSGKEDTAMLKRVVLTLAGIAMLAIPTIASARDRDDYVYGRDGRRRDNLNGENATANMSGMNGGSMNGASASITAATTTAITTARPTVMATTTRTETGIHMAGSRKASWGV